MSADIRLYPFQCGSTIIPLRNHILGAGLAGEMITTPVIWFLLTHPRGNVIIDGGNPAEVAIPELKHWGKILEMSSVEMSPEEEVTVALEQHGFDLADIRWIVQSHLHLDHTGAVAAIERFPNAQVLVTRTEYDFAMAPEGYFAMGYIKADYDKPGHRLGLPRGRRGRLRPLRRRRAALLAHARALAGAPLVRGAPAERRRRRCWRWTRPTRSITWRSASSRASCSRPSTRAARSSACAVWPGAPNALVIAGHDPDQWPTIKRAPDFYS